MDTQHSAMDSAMKALKADIKTLSKKTQDLSNSDESLQRLYLQQQKKLLFNTKAFIISMIPETLRNVSKMNARTIDAFRAMIRASLPPEYSTQQQDYIVNKSFVHFRKSLSSIKLGFNTFCAELSTQSDVSDETIRASAEQFCNKHLFRQKPEAAVITKLSQAMTDQVERLLRAEPEPKRRKMDPAVAADHDNNPSDHDYDRDTDREPDADSELEHEE